jgi:adenine-specific DNA-methyltransferase
MSKFDELVTKLREIFQIDRPELDFGVYRILNARADEINEYLTKRLREQVEAALATGSAANMEAQQRELDETIKALTSAGVDPESAPKVKELRAAIANASSGASDHENAVFSHLLAFFSRYYDKGDFISQRRYKGDTYAIPYAGEEVVLHWANKDQYYTKSGEAFSNYGFKLPDGRAVRFQLIAADTAKDNRKDNDKDRRFALAEARTVTRVDDEGEPYEEELVPIAEEDGDLVIRFEYRAFPAKTKQESLVEAAVEAVLADETVKASWLDLTTRAPTDKNPQRTVLEKHLTTYTQKNTADYFIHKDLGTFLRRELDFYIKNEVMNLDDVQDAKSFAAIEANLRMIQCLRAIAQDLITFLASIEDFQKKLWLKKKFVVAAHYCVTLDRVPEALYDRIAANPAQWAQWHDLGMRDSAAHGTAADLQAQPYLMVDTALFDAGFRADLLKAIPDLDASVDGLLVHGDNFQALRLLENRYRSTATAIYVDPPYNTDAGPIAYKNELRNSSWMTLMSSRIDASKGLLEPNGVFCITIDDYQVHELAYLLDQTFGPDLQIGSVMIRNNPSGRSTVSGISVCHEYALFYGNSDEAKLERLPRSEKQLDRFTIEDGRHVDWRNFRKDGGAVTYRVARPKQYYPIYVDKASLTIRIPQLEWLPVEREWKVLDFPKDGEVEVLPFDDKGRERIWSLNHTSAQENMEDLEARRDRNGQLAVFRRHTPNEGVLPRSWWDKNTYAAREYGSATLTAMFGDSAVFSFAKSPFAVEDCLRVSGLTEPESLVIDYFAGSGTTGHATISLNRQDAGSRRYVLVDQGEYFDGVLKPRIQKAVYSSDWKAGQPTTNAGISHAFKVLKIESYEDALNNLTLRRDPRQQGLLERMGPGARDEYVMRYMLDVEACGSLLSVEDFAKPFDYELDIAVDSAGATRRTKVDLLETFNYLIGLTVKAIDIQLARGFATVEGTLPDGKRTLILWRDCEKVDYDGLTKLCARLAINPGDTEYDVVYVNGDHNLPTKLQASEADGGGEKELNIRQIEPEFLSRMFDVADA